MNSKKNSFKRVAAGALAVLTVAAYTAPVANVGGLPSVKSLVAEAATGDTMVKFGTASNYITNASDGTITATATQISSAEQYRFTADTVLTIASKVPLEFKGYDDPATDGEDESADLFTRAAAGTNLLEKDANGKYKYDFKYLETENSNGTYTYKVRVVTGLEINGVTTTAKVVNANYELTLTDGNKVQLAKVEEADIKANTTSITNAQTTIAPVVIKSNAKITATKMFEAYVVDNTDAQAPIVNVKAVYDAVSGKFVAEAPIPSTGDTIIDGRTTKVSIFLNKVSPEYTYKNNGTTLTASAANAPEVTAASITATYEAKVKKNKDEFTQDPSNAYKYDVASSMASGAKVPNESRVVLTFKNDTTGEITSAKDKDNPNTFYTLKITKDGKEIENDTAAFVKDTGVYPAAASTIKYNAALKSTEGRYVPGDTDGESTLAFSATGVYKVEYTVYTKTIGSNNAVIYTPRTLTYNFTIAPKSALTAKNVRLTASYENANADTKPVLNGSTVTNEDEKKIEKISKVGIVNGVVQIEVTENWKDTDIINVAPILFEDADDAVDFTKNSTFAAGAANNDGTPKSVIGTTKSSTLNEVNEMTIVYSNPEYSAGDEVVNVKWKLVEAKKAIKFTKNDDWNPDAAINSDSTEKYYFSTTVDKLKTFREDLFDTMTVENADIEDISFEYVKGYGITPTTEVLNYHEDGLPTEKGEYSVFFVYEGEIVASVNVKIGEHALVPTLTDAQLAYTYGTKKLSNDDIAYVDVNGKAVKDAGVKGASIKYYKATKLSASQLKKITADGKYEGNVVYTIGSDKYTKGAEVNNTTDPVLENVDGYINAGNYIVEISAADGITTVAKEGYELQTESFGLSVAKKAITAGMVVFDAVDYNDGSTVLPGKYTVKDTTVNGYEVKTAISGGTTSAKEIGEYNIGVQVSADETNYTGKVTAKWHVVKSGKDMESIKFSDAKTTIYDNGQIHFEITRPDDTQFANGVSKFGVVIDKDGKIDAPTKVADANGVMKYPRKTINNGTTNVEFTDAAKALQVGNGFKEGNQGAKQKAETPLTYGANIAIEDVDTGAWFRAYVIDGKGAIYYGEVIYVNLVQEATDALQLTMANDTTNVNALNATSALSGKNTVVVTKDEAKKDQSATVLANKSWRKSVQSGYNAATNQYYVYGSYTLEGNDLVKNSAVQAFGVVVDKKGAFTAPAQDLGGTQIGGKLAADGKTTVAEGLVLGKGFIEGKGGSNKMDADEYGALINPADSVTGVWVRAYVNLGKAKTSNKELIVYTDPVYITDVSTYYGADALLNDVTNFDHAKNVFSITLTAGAIASATLKSSGVVVDTSGKYLTKNPTNGNYTAIISDDAMVKAKAEMLLGKGFLQGKKNVANYTATVAPEKYNAANTQTLTNIPIVVRPYAVYTIGEKDVTIYGAPVVASDAV